MYKNVKVDLMVNVKMATFTEKRINTALMDLPIDLNNHGRHGLLSFLSSLHILGVCNLELESIIKGRANKLYKAALLIRCYVQHF